MLVRVGWGRERERRREREIVRRKLVSTKGLV